MTIPKVEKDLAATKRTFRLGTIGFGYPEWAGVFYPRDLKASEYLSFYSRFFDSVELDTTFHATPPVPLVERWNAATPDDFRFCVKTPKQITHENGLDRGVEPMRLFLDRMRHLGDKLAVVLVQFPPGLSIDAWPVMQNFLERLPADVRYAVEFRHPSWLNDRTCDLLSRLGMAWVQADYLNEPAPARVTTDFLYLRWIGVHHNFPAIVQEETDVTDRLTWWRDRILAADSQVTKVFGFFSNDYAGYSIASTNRFKDLLNLPVKAPSKVDLGELFGGELFGGEPFG